MGKIKIDDSLFETEQNALQAAMAEAASERHRDNDLLPHYKSLVDAYQKLLKVTRKVFHISDSQGQILQRHQNEIQNLLDNANQGFLTFGRDLKVDGQYSAECTRIFGRKIAGLPITELLWQGGGHFRDEMDAVLERVFSCREGCQQSELQQFPSVFRIGDKDVRVECKLIFQEDEAAERTLVMMILTDITERLRAEEQIRFLSYHDQLTSLFNRAYVELMLPNLEKPESMPLSIIMADMNGLKLVNDVFGHQQGDLLLVALAEALKKSCRQTDTIVRWGGDEFLILLPKTGSHECQKVCERIREACTQAEGCPIPLSAAIGTATRDEGVALLAEMFSIAENRMYNNKLTENRDIAKNIIASLEGMLHNRCFESIGHGERVKQSAAGFISFLGLDIEAAEMKPLGQLATLHDIGKIAIPKEILGKAGPLTAAEWEIVKNHSEIGYRMAQSIGEPALADIILAVHERWDGKGYPYGLKGEQIPLLARIFSIVDVYDVITHDRPYRAAMNEEAALRVIESEMGAYFDAGLARRFIDYMSRNPD